MMFDMHSPELPLNQEAPPDQSMSVGQAAGVGAIMGPSVIYIGQFVEPIPLLLHVPSMAAEAGLMGGSALAGALLMSAGRFIAQHVGQWRAQHSEVA